MGYKVTMEFNFPEAENLDKAQRYGIELIYCARFTLGLRSTTGEITGITRLDSPDTTLPEKEDTP